MDHKQSQTLYIRTFNVVDRMKVSPITLLHRTKLEHSSSRSIWRRAWRKKQVLYWYRQGCMGVPLTYKNQVELTLL